MNASKLKELQFSDSWEKTTEIKHDARTTTNLSVVHITQLKGRNFKRKFKPVIYGNNVRCWCESCGCQIVGEIITYIVYLASYLQNKGDEPSWANYDLYDLATNRKIKKHECAQSRLNSILEYNILWKIIFAKN